MNKKYDLRNLEEGSLVLNEEYGILDDDMCECMRKFYVKCKIESVKVKKDKKVKKKKENKCDDNLEFIDFDRFNIIKVIEEGVCGGKTCCIIVSFKDDDSNKKYILKEFKSSMNWGRDYEFVDNLKCNFGLIEMNVRRIKSNKGLGRIDSKKINLKGNWCFVDRKSVFCIMDYFENIGDVGKNKKVLEDRSVKKEMLKIRLFDGLFRSSDNILRNILVGSDRKSLISIDENDIYGKRKKVFNKSDWCLKDINKDVDMVKEIIKEFNLNEKIEMIKNKMMECGFNDKVEEMISRFENYEEIIMKEFK